MNGITLLIFGLLFVAMGFVFGFMVGFMTNVDNHIAELEKTKEEIKTKRDKLNNNLNIFKECKMQGYSDSMGILEKHIAELKGDKE